MKFLYEEQIYFPLALVSQFIALRILLPEYAVLTSFYWAIATTLLGWLGYYVILRPFIEVIHNHLK